MPSPIQATKQPTTDVAYTLDELLTCYDQHFVRRAYLTLLSREPDPEGLGYYLGRLRTGFSKLWILAQIRSSQESKARAPNLPWLDDALTRYRKGKYPLIGWIFRRGRDSEDDHPVESKLERKLRSIENQIYMLSDQSTHQLDQMEAALTELNNQVVPQSAAPRGGFSIGRTTKVAPPSPPEPESFKQLSKRAKAIYFRLQKAAAIHATGIN
jgi:Domain of unknown function (DUF4214)